MRLEVNPHPMPGGAHEVRDGGETVDSFADIGVLAFTTGRRAGSFSTGSDEPVRDVMARWTTLRAVLGNARLATATQVHGGTIVEHAGDWRGWLRGEDADGHLAMAPGTGMAVTVADCVPVFVAHPSGGTAALHSGWRGTAAGIAGNAITRLTTLGLSAGDLRVHCGPAICGRCYEVSPDVYGQLTGRHVEVPTTVDLRALITDQAHALGVRHITVSPKCTRCDNAMFFSHRAGDMGRQLGVILAGPSV